MATSSGSYNFADHLIACQLRNHSVLCCGLDPQLKYMPECVKRSARGISDPFARTAHAKLEFCRRIVDAVADEVCAFKINIGFFAGLGPAGSEALRELVKYIQRTELVIIGDMKIGDGGDTAEAYAEVLAGAECIYLNDSECAIQRHVALEFDAITVQIQIGDAWMEPFLKLVKPTGKGVICVVKTSFRPVSFVEEIVAKSDGEPVWVHMAKAVARWGQGTEGEFGCPTVGAVLGATRDEAIKMRSLLPKNPLLIPGFGMQGADAAAAVQSFVDDDSLGLINDSRKLTYAYVLQKDKYPGYKGHQFAEVAGLAAHDARLVLNEALERRREAVAL